MITPTNLVVLITLAIPTRFECHGELSDLEAAISRYRDAVDLIPHGHPDKPGLLTNLSSSFKTRFERHGEMSDLEHAISMLREADGLTPHCHPIKPTFLISLGDSSFTLSSMLILLPSASFLNSHGLASCLHTVTLNLCGVPMWCARLLLLLWNRDSWTPLWSGSSKDVQSFGESFFSFAAPTKSCRPLIHAHRLQELSVALEQASTTREKSLSALSEQTANHVSLQQKADKHRTLTTERDKLLQEIRRFPGFEKFLLRKEFSQLRASAHAGPVVILNAAASRCDPLIVLANVDHAIHVLLPTFTFQRSAVLQNMLEKLLGHARAIRCEDREGKSATRGCVSWEFFLSTLWNDVVKPVLAALAFSVHYFVSLEFIPDPFICL